MARTEFVVAAKPRAFRKGKRLTDYWYTHYCEDFCTLCGNTGVIDSRGVRTPAGHKVGRLNYCICPNGQCLRHYSIPMEAQLRQCGRMP